MSPVTCTHDRRHLVDAGICDAALVTVNWCEEQMTRRSDLTLPTADQLQLDFACFCASALNC